MLVTEREGRLRILGLDNKLSPVGPSDVARAAGRLLDVLDLRRQPHDLLLRQAGTMAQPPSRDRRGRVAIKVIFRQEPKVSAADAAHRFPPSGHIFLTTGDRQSLIGTRPRGHIGKVIRLNKDGRAEGQSICRPRARSRNLVLRPSQHPGRSHRPARFGRSNSDPAAATN
jgi:hypothetical protein